MEYISGSVIYARTHVIQPYRGLTGVGQGYREQMKIRNNFHDTETTIRPRDGRISQRAARAAKRRLCGYAGCTCSGPLGERGPQDLIIIEGQSYAWSAEDGPHGIEIALCLVRYSEVPGELG